MVVNGLANAMSGLNAKQLEAYISSKKLNVAQASLAMRQNGVSRATRMQILQNLGLIQSNGKLRISLKSIAAGLWETTKAWAMSPLGMATIAAVGIFAIVKIVDLLTTSLEESREALANLKEEYADNENELTTLNDELQTTIDRINELQGKDSLTFTEAEELDNLRRQNTELERQIALLETIQKQKNKEMNQAFVETMEKDLGNKKEYTFSNKYVSSNYSTQFGTDTKKYGKGRSVRTMSERDLMYSALMRYNELYAEWQNASGKNKEKIKKDLDDVQKYLTDKAAELASDAEGISYISNPTTDDEKAVNEWLDFINDFNDKLMITMGQSGAKENALNRLIFGSFSNATSELKNLGKQGEITAKHLEDSRYDAFIQKCIDLGIIADDSESSLEFLASGFNLLSEAAGDTGDGVDNTKKELNGLADSITNLQDAYTLLDKAMEEMEDGGLTVDTIKEITEQVDNLTDYLYIENGAIKLNTQAWREYAKAKVASDVAEIQSSIKKLEEDNKTLEAKKKEYEDNRAIGSDGGMWNNLIIQQDKAIAANNKEIAKNQQLLDIYNTLFNDIASSTNQSSEAFKQYMKALSKTNALETGFSKLSDIFNDVKDGGDFDWGSIIDDNFEKEFGGFGASYEKFMQTIATSPRDLSACRSAFNELATAYIANTGALDDVTESNRDAVVAMLEQMGVTNAAVIVDEQLALQKERLKYATAEYTNLTYDQVLALYNEAAAGSVAKQALAELAVQKYLEQNTTFNTEADIEQLLTMAQAANVTTASYSRLLEAKALLAQADSAYAQYKSEYRGGNPNELASYQRYLQLKEKANSILSSPLEYETISPADLIVDFEGVSKAAGNAKDNIESLYDSAKNGIEKLIDYRESILEKDIENQKDAIEEQIDALQDFYDEQREMLEEQYDEEEYLAEQHERQKAVTDLKGELAMLVNDDSAWAQRRKLELKEELLEAEDELAELEKERALDVTLDMLDDQQEAQEKQLQDQIDALDERLNDPHALHNQALSDIRNNTLDLYQEMIEFNRRWGSGNDDDIRDMWNDAYESNEDYRDKTGSTYKDIELGDYAGYDASGVGKVSSVSSTLRQGSKGDGVKALQHALNQLGYGNSGTRSLDGSFGSGTRSAVIAFQRANGLTGDGVVGSATKSKFKTLGYATGTDNATPGWHELFEGDLDEYIFTSGDGSRYRMFSGLGDKVLNAGATDFLYQFANSGGSILTQMIADLFKRSGLNNISKPVQTIEVNTGNVIVEGNADMKTVSEIRRAQRENLNFVLKSLNSLNK